MSKQAPVSKPIDSLLPTDVDGFDFLAELAMDMRWSWMPQSSTVPRGIGIWPWSNNDQGVTPDVVMACGGDVPKLETLVAVSIMREQLPYLKIRVVNVVDLMKLQPQRLR